MVWGTWVLWMGRILDRRVWIGFIGSVGLGMVVVMIALGL